MSLLMNALKKAEQAKHKEGGQDEPSKAPAEHKATSIKTLALEEPVIAVPPQQESDTPVELALEISENPDTEDSGEVNLTLDEIIVEPELSVQQESELPDIESAPEAEENTEHKELMTETPVPDEPVVEIEAHSQEDSDSSNPEESAQLPETKTDNECWPGLDDEPDGKSQVNEALEPAQTEVAANKDAVTTSAISQPDKVSCKEQHTTATDSHQVRRKFSIKTIGLFSGNLKSWLPAVSVLILLLLSISGYYYFNHFMSGLGGSSVMTSNMPAAESYDEEGLEIEAADTSLNNQNETQPQQAAQLIEQDNIATPDQVKSTHSSVSPAISQPMKQGLNEKPVLVFAIEEESALAKLADENQPEVTASKPIAKEPKIRIVRKQKVDPTNQLLNSAYQAYKAGNDAKAAKEYQAALIQDRSNRDALLGLAVIAHRNNNRELASSYYASLLKLNPRDSIAISGLVALKSGSSPVENESRIKLLLNQEPGAAHLHFTLATLYASQSRWADAQQSFFNAHRYDPENSDYAYNLAVSLDRIKQRETALNYYQLALKLANGNQVMFNLSEVNKRVNTLLNLKKSSQ